MVVHHKVLARRVSSRPMDAHFGRNTRKIHLISYTFWKNMPSGRPVFNVWLKAWSTTTTKRDKLLFCSQNQLFFDVVVVIIVVVVAAFKLKSSLKVYKTTSGSRRFISFFHLGACALFFRYG